MKKAFLVIMLLFSLAAMLYSQTESGSAASPATSSTSSTDTGSTATSPAATSVTPAPETTTPAATTAPKDSDTTPLSEIDFTSSIMQPAGPDAIYIRGATYKGQSVSLLFKYSADNVWKLARVVPESENLFTSDMVFEFAQMRRLDPSSLEIEGILKDGKAYKTAIHINEDNTLTMTSNFESGELVGAGLTRFVPVASKVLEDKLTALDRATAEVDSTKRVNQDLLSRIGDIQKSLDAKQEAQQKSSDEASAAIAALQTKNTDLAKEIVALQTQITDLQSAKSKSEAVRPLDAATQEFLQQLKASLVTLNDQVTSLNARVDVLATAAKAVPVSSTPTVSVTTKPADTPAPTIDETALKARIKTLEDQNAELTKSRQELEISLRSKFIASGYIAAIAPNLSKTVLKGFQNSVPRIGSWKVAAATAVQTDPSAAYAQLDLPLVQHDTTMLYKFSLKSLGKNWIGAGIHIYASSAKKKTYGHGKSLLVWLTRDPDFYKNNRTYLQLYRSDDDVNMERMFDVAITDDITQMTSVEVLYQPNEEYITIAINGVEKLRYKTWFGVNSGVELSLRSLDITQFQGLEVLSAP